MKKIIIVYRLSIRRCCGRMLREVRCPSMFVPLFSRYLYHMLQPLEHPADIDPSSSGSISGSITTDSSDIVLQMAISPRIP